MPPGPALQMPASELPGPCYHCGEAVPAGADIRAVINGEEQPMCCYGCRAVAETIDGLGLGKYYRYRTGPAVRPETDAPAERHDFRIYDQPDIQAGFVRSITSDHREVTLIIEDIVCPACTWLIETHLNATPGVDNVMINYSSGKATIRWNSQHIALSRILEQIHALGYRACPFDSGRMQQIREKERKTFLLRIGVAGLLGMQVMMIAIALYAGKWSGIDAGHRAFLSWISLILTLPVLLFSGWPFYRNTWRAIKNRRIDMDVPLACGISVAFLGSVLATIKGSGDIYFDSVVMLIFFLLCGRYLEFMVKTRAALHLDSIAKVIPAMAIKLPVPGSNDPESIVPVAALRPGDLILVKPGDTVPVDGRINSGDSTLNESVITGEFMPVHKHAGDNVIAGSVNNESPVRVTVTATGDNTCLSYICSLVEQAQSVKPRMTLLADRVASWFLFSVLLLAVVTAGFWLITDPALWIPATVAVLVISCPCALSLATPTAVTVASNRLLKRGIAVLHTDALETLDKITHVAMDKTGTLTEGKLAISDMHLFRPVNENEIMVIAGSLESHSGHAIAHAFDIDAVKKPDVQEPVNFPGQGISGIINNRQYFIGSPAFISTHVLLKPDDAGMQYRVLLADDRGLLAGFNLEDRPRENLDWIISCLKQTGIRPLILSGDNEQSVAALADTAGIDEYYAAMDPQAKLEKIRELQAKDHRVIMLGDGINDAPVMAAADVAIALDSGTDLSKINADVVLLGNNLAELVVLLNTARNTRSRIAQNIRWAITYNLLAVPAAMVGLVAPWAAAIGMSASSLLVVANSLRPGKAAKAVKA